MASSRVSSGNASFQSAAIAAAITTGSKAKKAHFRVRALFDYVAQDVDDLDFREGETIEVLDGPDGEDWWKGRLGGREGSFPANYVERI